MAAADDLIDLRSRWKTLYSETLPALARAKDAAQPRWPVNLDHCFARIILDNTIGAGKLQWDHVIQKPAVKNMDQAQLTDAIQLGEMIQNGKADLAELDRISLQARGKDEKKYRDTKKRRPEHCDSSWNGDQNPSKKAKAGGKKQSVLPFAPVGSHTDADNEHSSCSERSDGVPDGKISKSTDPNPNLREFLIKIQRHPDLTLYRKRLYSTLLSVPPGRYTTYQAMATFLESSARAVGNGMRNNPYAPDVPCHRVLASNGSIGGFYGSWGEEGKYAGKKRELLQGEGVYFDSKGRVKGPVFRDFEDLSKREDL